VGFVNDRILPSARYLLLAEIFGLSFYDKPKILSFAQVLKLVLLVKLHREQ